MTAYTYKDEEHTNSFTFAGKVRFSEVDHTKHLSLPGVINYFQDCTTFQSESLNLGTDYFEEHHRAWILSYWHVVVDRYPKMAEDIFTTTWAANFKGMLGDRNFIMRDKDGNKLAYGKSIWVYMDTERKRPARPLPEEIAPYGEGKPLDMGNVPRKITLPKETEALPQMKVGRDQIDTNGHMNNSQYIRMALRALDEEQSFRQIRVEYKKSAMQGDIVVPRVCREAERTVVVLSDTEAEPYAIVELV